MQQTRLILFVFDLIISENKKELYAAVGEFYKAKRGWFLMQGEIICCTGDNCNTKVPSLPPAGNEKHCYYENSIPQTASKCA